MTIHRASKRPGDLNLETDVVVVGSGASAAVVAAELAQAGQRVVLLEEGPHVPPDEYAKMRPTEQIRHMWRDASMTFALGLGDTPMINVMMGRCVGGSSVHTGGICFRIPDSVLHEWEHDHGLRELNAKALDPVHAAVEKVIQVQEVPEHHRSRSTNLFEKGLQATLGAQLKPLRRNIVGCQGFSRCNFGCPHHAKMSVDVSYLPTAFRHGAELYADCLVERVVHKNGRAVGVKGRVLNGRDGGRGGKLSVRARRVVMAAGAYHSPLLLKRSGVGRFLDHVGNHLTLHPSFRVMGRFDEPVHGWRGALQSAYSDVLEAHRITLIGLFTPPGVLAATMPGVGPEHHRHAQHIPHLAMFGGLIHDDAGGRVRRAIGREPFVTYRMAPRDRAAVPVLMRTMAEIFFAAGAREVFLPVLGLGGVTADRLKTLDLEHIPGQQLECGSQHPLGTCRMGVSSDRSVVNPDGEAWDLPELYVVDGSILPTSLGVNPQLAVMTMAQRIAWKLREKPLPG